MRDCNLSFRINSQASIEWSGSDVAIKVPSLPAAPPFIVETGSHDTYRHKRDSLAHVLLDALRSPRSYGALLEKASGAAADEFASTLSELERKRIVVPAFSSLERCEQGPPLPRRSFSEKLRGGPHPLSPVLLVGGGAGQATMGLPYLASYLQAHGVAASVWASRDDEMTIELRERIANLFSKVSYALVGISLKWFHHVSCALLLGAVIHDLYPDVLIVYGGNSATLYRRELLLFPFVDCVVRGDGELPLLRICRGDVEAPNCAYWEDGLLTETAHSYSQRGSPSEEIRLGGLERLYLSRKDLVEASALVVGGKGCDANCVYCGGSQPNQIRLFRREHSFLRPMDDVRDDVLQMLPYNAGLFVDFTSWDGDLERYLRSVFSGIELSQRSLTFVSWMIPTRSLLEFLSSRFRLVHALIDVGCLSERQRKALWRGGFFKHAASDEAIFDFFDACERADNVLCGAFSIYGLPFVTEEDLEAERRFVERLAGRRSYLSESDNLLQAQPGSLVTENAGAFGMSVDVQTFWDYLRYFEDTGQSGHLGLRVRFQDGALDAKVVASAKEAAAKISELLPTRYDVGRLPREEFLETALVQEIHLRFAVPESEWYGNHGGARAKEGPAAVVYKNFQNVPIHLDKAIQLLAKPGCDVDACAVADEIIDAFETPSTVAEAFRRTTARRFLPEEVFVSFVRLATRWFLLRRAKE